MMQWTWEYKYLFEKVISFLLDVYPKVRLLNNMVVLSLAFWEISTLFFIVVVSTYILMNSIQGFSSLQSSPTLVILVFFYNNHPDRCKVILIVVLICISLWLVMLSTFSCTCWLFVYPFWKNVYSSVLPTLKFIFCFLLLSYVNSLYNLDINPLSNR